MKTLTLILCSALLALPSFADNTDWRCERARQELFRSRAEFRRAEAMVYSNSYYCPGGWNTNYACMLAIANRYNRAKMELQRARERVRFACHHGWDDHDWHDGHGGHDHP